MHGFGSVLELQCNKMCSVIFVVRFLKQKFLNFSGSSENGTAFRDTYNRLSECRSFTKAPVIGLTATATQSTLTDISNSLSLKRPLHIKDVKDRSDIK